MQVCMDTDRKATIDKELGVELPYRPYAAERAVLAMKRLGEAAQKNGTANMTLDEINAEIAAAREENAKRFPSEAPVAE